MLADNQEAGTMNDKPTAVDDQPAVIDLTADEQMNEKFDASGSACRSTSSGALVQCCTQPWPVDVGDDHGITSFKVVCFNCNTTHDVANIFAPDVQSAGDVATAVDDLQHLGFRNVNDELDPNRIRMVKYVSPDNRKPVGQPPAPSVSHQPTGEALFSQCYNAKDTFRPAPSFPNFMKLPRELRDRIYGFALKSDESIAPHLCHQGRPALGGKADDGNAIRFHDENQTAHNATCKILAIARVSKQVREESLPVFYGVNTFETIGDTPTYFFRLQQLGRFHMIRHVDFWVRLRNNDHCSQTALRMLLQNIEEQKAFEIGHQEATQDKRSGKATAVSEDTTFYTDDLHVLKCHPLHAMGGIEASFLVLRMLSAQFQDSVYSRQLVIHVPTTKLFEQYNGLVYFPSVCEGLGIQLKLISGRDVDIHYSSFRLSWDQKFQKKEFTATTTAKDLNEVEVLTRRVQALYPNIEELPRAAKWTYMRRLCKQNDIEWFSIKTAGGGIW